MIRAVFCALLSIALLAGPAANAAETLLSPGGAIAVTVDVTAEGRPFYKIAFRGDEIVGQSHLGFRFRDQPALEERLTMTGSARSSKDESWEQPWGERRLMRDQHNELTVSFATAEKKPRRFSVRFRAFDDGVGFRYEFPDQKAMKSVAIVNELTEFRLPEDATYWWIPGRRWNRYEYLYRTTKADAIDIAHTPVTLKTKSGAHLSIHEAALVDYAGMALNQQRPGIFKADLAPWSDGVLVKKSGAFTTPWRTIQIAPDAKSLLASTLILNLNEPNKLGDVSWIEPGVYAGVWWEMHVRDSSWGEKPLHGATTANTKRYIDFAAQHGFTGVLVEGWNIGWDDNWFGNGDVFDFTKAYPDFDIEEIGRYAQEKGVRLIGHHETGGAATHYENQMGAAFDLYERAGVRTVKTGYVADGGGIQRVDDNGVETFEWHDGQFMANHHLNVVKSAARRKIAINPHEPIKDTGLRRTYPNWIAREGARGQEFNAWGQPPNPPEHDVILPFTRLLSGPMDFTPGVFDVRPNERPAVNEELGRNSKVSRVETTLAKQLALYVTVYSPIQMAADLPQNYEARPAAFQFIKDVATDWEETIGVAAEIGDYAAIARKERRGEDWFLGAITDENARTMDLPLSFLDEGKTYVAEIYRDGPKADYDKNPYDIVIEKREMTRADTLRLSLGRGGGAAARFSPKS